MDLKKIPTGPGVYLLKHNKSILYVGKALNIRERVKTHLVAKLILSPRAQMMREEVNKVDFIPVRSGFEALLLEINLIKKHQPPFNIKLKDAKDYLFLKITAEEFPRVLCVRQRELAGSLYYLGPFPNAQLLRRTVRSLRRIFPFCNEKKKTGKPCFYFHLGLCLGACTQNVSQKEYRQMIRGLTSFLDGKTGRLLLKWQKEMEHFSSTTQYEKAALVRDKIAGIDYLLQENRTSEYLQKPDLLDDLMVRESEELKTLLQVSGEINRIECYDISHNQGSFMTGSMVVFNAGQPDKAEYRRFRIKKVRGIDDFASLQEVLRRRFQNDWQMPDLVVIDGGKGQLSASLEVKKELNLTVPFISLAKREEEIYTQEGKKLRISRTNPALQLVQRLRDEAHRFAVTYHRKLRSDALTGSKI